MTADESKVVQIAEGIIAGTIGVVAGSRKLKALQWSVSKVDNDIDFRAFAGIDSESDHIPLGDVRKRWAPDSLKEKDEELKKIDGFYRSFAKKSCRALIKRFKRDD